MTYVPHWPKRPPSPSQPAIALDSFTPIKFTKSLHNMTAIELAQLLFKEVAPPDSYPLDGERKRKTSDPLTCMDMKDIIELLHTPDSSPPPIRPCDTPNPSDTKSHWTAKELHCITGCHHFCNYWHLLSVSKDGTYIDNGEFPTSIHPYTTIPKAPHGTTIDRTSTKYLDVVHLDIAFGDCMSVDGFKYTLIFVDRATRYNWCFGLKSLHHDNIIAAFFAFRSEAGSLAKQFCCDCNEKLFGSHIRSFLHLKRSPIIASPAGRHSANGLVESHWKIMVHMSREYLIEKQIPRTFWYFTIKHSARMMNMIPGKYKGKLASPFMLVHGVRPDPRTWLPLFLLCYFHHKKDSDVSRSKNQAHTLDGIVIGWSSTLNALLVYNPCNQQYYKPHSYRLDSYCLPSSVYPSIVYDGGLFVSLHRDGLAPTNKPYPPGTRVAKMDPDMIITLFGTVMDIPIDPATSPQYLILF